MQMSHVVEIEMDLDEVQLPYFFAVGCPRSGTTLLQRILDHHPSLAVGYDTHFIPQGVRRFPIDIDPPLTNELAARVRSHRRFPRLGLDETAVDRAEKNSATYSEFVGRLYEEFAFSRGKLLAGEKSPGYCRHIPRLHNLFPKARFIHLIRDGRDVALSVLDWGKGQPRRLALWDQSPIATCALWWKWKVGKGIRDGRELKNSVYREIRYEGLVHGPETATRSLVEFLGIPFCAEMLDYHKGKTRRSKGLSAKAAWIPPTPGLRDWRSQMKSADVELFEALAGDLLTTLGYERAFTTFAPSVLKMARAHRDWWETEMSARRTRRIGPDIKEEKR